MNSMDRVVWKFDIPSRGAAEMGGWICQIPAQARFLHAAEQHPLNPQDEPIISTWWEVDPNMPKLARRFQVYGTGHPIDDYDLIHLCTTLHLGGMLVLHLYYQPYQPERK